MRRFSISVVLMTFCILASTVSAQYSDLWGKDGEKWQPSSRLPDFSFAGYRFGEAQPPTPPVGASVKDFGAVGDGKTDDTAAFKRAVTEAEGKVILIPKGTYVLSDRIEFGGIGTVLRGETRDESVLIFTKGLEELYPAPAVNDGGQATSNWSWTGGLLSIKSTSMHRGAKGKVTGTAQRGDTKITLADVSNFNVGDFINLIVYNDPSGSLIHYLYRGDTGNSEGLTGNRSSVQVNKIVSIEGNVLTLIRPLRFDIKPEFGAEVLKVDPQTTECGIENLTLEFKSGIYRGHFKEMGFNGITISTSAIHCWVRRVRLVDADSGIFGAGTHGTIDDVVIESRRKSLTPDNIKGHHGVDGGLDCLIQNVTFKCLYHHDLSVGGGNTGNVFRQIKGEDINMDQHRWGPYENLFTNIDLGAGQRPWLSGGGANRGKHTAAGTTFWNLRSKRAVELPYDGFGPPPIQFVGVRVRGRDQKEDGKWWLESINPSDLQPQDLYQAQLNKRLAEGRRMFPQEAGNSLASGNASITGADSPLQNWTSVEGRTIKARFAGLEGSGVKLVMESGQTFLVQMEKLNAESRAQAQALGRGN